MLWGHLSHLRLNYLLLRLGDVHIFMDQKSANRSTVLVTCLSVYGESDTSISVHKETIFYIALHA